jgi:hypothetical protein
MMQKLRDLPILFRGFPVTLLSASTNKSYLFKKSCRATLNKPSTDLFEDNVSNFISCFSATFEIFLLTRLLLTVNLWGFERLLRGPNRGGYQNANFVHRRPSLCHKMKRVEIKGIENMKLAMTRAPIKTMDPMQDMKSGLPDNMLSFSSSIIEWKDPSSMDLFDDDTLSSVLPNSFFDVSPGSDDQSPIESIENERRIQTEMTLSIGEQRINPFFFTYSQ